MRKIARRQMMKSNERGVRMEKMVIKTIGKVKEKSNSEGIVKFQEDDEDVEPVGKQFRNQRRSLRRGRQLVQ